MHFLYYKTALLLLCTSVTFANPETLLDAELPIGEAVCEKNQLPKWYLVCRVERQLRDADGLFQHDRCKGINPQFRSVTTTLSVVDLLQTCLQTHRVT